MTNTPSSRDSASTARDGQSQRTWGYITGGAGVVALGAGAAFGLLAIAKNGASKATCDASNACDAAGKTLRDDARTLGDASTIAFVAGGLALGAGVTLVLTAPHADRARTSARVEVAPMIGGGAGGMTVRGAW